jgi:hypothetical protein
MSRSVLQDWVMELPLREQGALVVGTRGCDEAPKTPYDSTERQLTAFLRYCILVPADEREVGVSGAFFQKYPPQDWRQSELGHYPLHWFTHIMHAYQIVAYRHPHVLRAQENGFLLDADGSMPYMPECNLATQALMIYLKLVRGLHLMPESMASMVQRLSEDRIANDTVVS